MYSNSDNKTIVLIYRNKKLTKIIIAIWGSNFLIFSFKKIKVFFIIAPKKRNPRTYYTWVLYQAN